MVEYFFLSSNMISFFSATLIFVQIVIHTFFVGVSFGALDRSMLTAPPSRSVPFQRPTPPTTFKIPVSTSEPVIEDDKIVAADASPAAGLEIIASLPKIAVSRNRLSCASTADRKNTVVNGSRLRVASRVVVMKPGKNVHCSKIRQSTSGLDCPCVLQGERCAPANSVCSLFSADLATCGCNLATSARKGARCVANEKSISARGMGFRVFSPAPVLEVSCRLKPCATIGTLNVSVDHLPVYYYRECVTSLSPTLFSSFHPTK